MKTNGSQGCNEISGQIVSNVRKTGVVSKSSAQKAEPPSVSLLQKKPAGNPTTNSKYSCSEIIVSKEEQAEAGKPGGKTQPGAPKPESKEECDDEEIPDEDIKETGDNKQNSRSTNIGKVTENSVPDVKLSGLARSKPVKKRQKEDKKGKEEDEEEKKATLKETKAPDPFEAQYKRRENELGGIIASTGSPENPLYHLRQSGVNTPAIKKAYKHFVISLFESILFVQRMKPITEAQVQAQKVSLARPKGLLSKHIVIYNKCYS